MPYYSTRAAAPIEDFFCCLNPCVCQKVKPAIGRFQHFLENIFGNLVETTRASNNLAVKPHQEIAHESAYLPRGFDFLRIKYSHIRKREQADFL